MQTLYKLKSYSTGNDFKYLSIKISVYADIKDEIRSQATEATKIAASLNNVIWRNNAHKERSKISDI